MWTICLNYLIITCGMGRIKSFQNLLRQGCIRSESLELAGGRKKLVIILRNDL